LRVRHAGVFFTGAVFAGAAEQEIPPAFGPRREPETRGRCRKPQLFDQGPHRRHLFLHWYDIHARARLVDPDGTDAPTAHPPGLEHCSCKSVRWHKRRLADMEAAGIDLALMAFRD
jgi:hypothetical protein